MKKISPMQAAALMLCFSLGRLIGFRPDGDNLLICAAAEIVCGAVLTAVCAALPSSSPKNGFIGKTCAAVSGVWLLMILTLLMKELAGSLDYSFPDFYAAPAVIAVSAAAAAYCASLGLRGCARAACAVAVLTVLVLLLTASGAAERFDPERLDLAVSGRGVQFARQLLRQFSRSAEFPLFILLRGRIEHPRRAVLIRFAGQAVISAGFMIFCAGILGERGLSGIPADTLSSFSKTSVIERFDALMLLVWTLCLVFSAAALLIGLERCVSAFTEKSGKIVTGAAILCAAGAAFLPEGSAPAVPVTAGILGGAMILTAAVPRFNSQLCAK